jgi:hypothetical protein
MPGSVDPASQVQATLRFLNFLNPNENFCAMVQARLQKEAGRLVVTHKADPSMKPGRVKGIPVVIVSPFYSSFHS